MSVAAKSLINLVIEPIVPGTPLSALRDQFYPYPPGRFAITLYEHRHDGWPDYSDGVYGEISSCLGGFIAWSVAFDSVEIIVFFGLAILIVGYVSISTFGKSRSGMLPTHVAVRPDDRRSDGKISDSPEAGAYHVLGRFSVWV